MLLGLSMIAVPAGALQGGAVTGTVTDGSGAVLPGATVEAILGSRVIATATTGTNGQYRLTLPANTDVRIRAELAGFTADTAVVEAGATQNFQLGLAPVNDTVVVTASRTAESRTAITESLSVFTAEDIQALGSTSLADIVTTIPGLNIEATGREGSTASLFSRGGESDYNHVLIDGVRVNVDGGHFDFSRVSAAEIDRVEVVRGAQSALYGSDAIGSVVQIFTKRGTATESPRIYGSFESGSFETVRSDLRLLGGAQQQFDYQFGGTYRGSNGAFKDLLPDHDRFDQTSYDAAVGGILRDQVRFRTGGRYSNKRGRAVGPIAYGVGDNGTRADTEDYSYYLTFDQSVNPWFTHSGFTTYLRNDQQSNDDIGDPSYNVFALLDGVPGAIFPESPRLVRLLEEAEFNTLVVDASTFSGNQFLASTPFGVADYPFTFASEFRRYTFEYQGNLTWADNQILSAGYEYEREEDRMRLEDLSGPGFRIVDHSFFAQQQLTFADQWFATAGVRVDNNSRFGTEANPKLSIGGYPQAINRGTISSVKVFANVGRGVKNPNSFELFGSGFVDGNPNLSPEHATTVDAGSEVTFDSQRWLVRATWFNNNYEDQVAFSYSPGFGGDGIPDYVNVNGSRARGFELETGLQRPIGGLTAMASYAYVNTEVVSNISTTEMFQPGQPLLRRPKHSGHVRVNYAHGPASVHVNVRVVGDRHDAAFLGLTRHSDGAPVDITLNPGYALVGLGVQYRIRRELTIFLRADNLTDETFENALGYVGLPQAFVGGGRFNFGR